MKRLVLLVRYLLALAAATYAGCSLATPIAPTANASNTAANTATASPNVQVQVPTSPTPTSAPAATATK